MESRDEGRKAETRDISFANMKKKTNFKWVVRIVMVSIAASTVFTLATTGILGNNAGYVAAVAVLTFFIAFGIAFDIISIAVTAAKEAPFHSMAAHRQRGASESLRLVRNADKVVSLCSDVVGDVSGIVSGATAALIAARLMEGFDKSSLLFPLIVSGAVTGLTVGGKAAGKAFAFNNSTGIVLWAGKLINFFHFKPYRKK